jgi:hypothetical protein
MKHYIVGLALTGIFGIAPAAAQVAISALPSATTPLAGTEVVPCVQSTTTKKCAVSDIGAILPNVVTAGTTGDSTHVPQITVDAKGRITSITSILITGGSGAVSSVFGRTGVVIATIGDYSFDLISGSVTLAQLPSIADNTLLGNTSGGSHVPAALTVNSGSNCGDSTHALKWTNDTGFGCQAITGSASAGGSDTQLQRNNGSALGGISGATTDGTAVTMASGDLKLSGSSSGTVILNAPATGGGTLTLPAGTDTVAALAATQTFTNKSIAASEVNSGTLSASQMPALTGDVATSAGAVATTLATVNSNVGTFGDSTHCASVTVNGKGLVTAASQGTSCPGGAGSGIAVTDGTNSVSGTTTAIFGNGFRVSGTTPNATINSTLSDITKTTSHSAAIGDMGNALNLSGTFTLTLPTATGSLFAPGQSLAVLNSGSGNITLTNSTGLTMTGLNSTTLIPGTSGTFIANANGTGIDFFAAMQTPSATALGGVLSSTCAATNFVTGITTGGALTCAVPSGGGGASTIVSPQPRFSLQSGAGVETADVAPTSTTYLVCWGRGNNIPYYTGSADALDTPACGTNVASDVMPTSSTGVTNSGAVIDFFWCHSCGGGSLVHVTDGSGGGWAADTSGSATARGTGYSAVHYTRGYWTNTNAIGSGTTGRVYNGSTLYNNIAADQLTYYDTCQMTAAGTTRLDLLPTPAAGGTNNVIGCWNAYKENRVSVTAKVVDTTTGFTYGTATWLVADASNTGSGLFNRLTQVFGLPQTRVTFNFNPFITNASVAPLCLTGVDLDSTSANPNLAGALQPLANSGAQSPVTDTFAPGSGVHYLQEMVFVGASGTCSYGGIGNSFAMLVNTEY